MRAANCVYERDLLIRGWGYTPGLQYVTLADSKTRQNLFLIQQLNIARIPLVNSILVYIALKRVET